MKILAALIVGLAIGYSAQALAAPKAQTPQGSVARQLATMNRQLKTLAANVRKGQQGIRTEQETMHGDLRSAQATISTIDTRTARMQGVLSRLCAAHAFGIDCNG